MSRELIQNARTEIGLVPGSDPDPTDTGFDLIDIGRQIVLSDSAHPWI
jgi:hypothetical protein